SFALEPRLSAQVRASAGRHGVTLFMILLAAFKALLFRVTGQRDLLVGFPIAGRNRREVEEMIGLFVNTLVLRSRIEPGMTFAGLLAQIESVALDAYAHQDLPFERLVDELAPERDLSHSPLFQVMFVFQNPAAPLPSLGEVELSPVEIPSRSAQFDLILEMRDGGERLEGALDYNADLFDATTVERMVRQLRTLLAAAADPPPTPIAELPLLSAAQRQQLLVEWRGSSGPRIGASVCELFQEQAARSPDAAAVEHRGRRLSYGELDRRCDRLARHLHTLGIRPEDRVGLLVERSPEMVVALLGILKAGAAYLPLAPETPPRRLAETLRDAGAALVVTVDSLAPRLPTGVPVLVLDRDPSLRGSRSDSPPSSVPRLGSLAYVIYTSGSTGVPKGVMVEHRSLVSYAAAAAADYALAAGDRVLQFASLTFDASAEEIFPTLLSGATLVLRDELMLATAGDFLDACRRLGITVLNLPTSYWHELCAGLGPRAALPAAVRLVIIGGERALSEPLARWYREVGAGTRLVNTYGPTEATIVATSAELEADTSDAGISGEVPIGRPVAGARVVVLDPRRLQAVPAGVVGELHIGGAGVARGYLDRPALSAERFVPDPHSSRPGARLYRTGDLARFRPGGSLEFVGRSDHQVKVRGYRVEPGEIEAALIEHPAVQEAVVVAHRDGGGRHRLAAYVAPAAAGQVASALRDFLASRLPRYLVPATFTALAELPKTASGKVDRKRLPDPAAPARDGYQAPRNEVEEKLQEIWSRVLKVDRVGVDDNFFDLGGDSILSIQIVARASRVGLRLEPRQMFEHQTIAELATATGASAAEGATSVDAEQGLVTGALPLTPIHRWLFEQNLPAPEHFNQALLFELRRRLPPALLAAACRRMVAHHDALRLRFTASDEAWRAEIAPLDRDASWLHLDLRALPPERRPDVVEAVAAEIQAGFDLAGPLFRALLFDLGDGDAQRLLLVGHHSLVDGVSWRILSEDLERLCDGLLAGRPVELPPKTTSFQRWAEALVEHAAGAEVAAEAAFWQTQAAAPEIPRLPVDGEGGEDLEAASRQVADALPAADTNALLRETAAAYSNTVEEILLTALVEACGGWTGSRRLLIDLEGHGRESIAAGLDVSRTVGWFTTVYPVLFDLQAAGEPGAALMAVKEQLRQVPGRGISYGLLRHLAPDGDLRRELGRQPRAEISFNYLGRLDGVAGGEQALLSPARESAGPAVSPANPRPYLLEVDARIVGGRLEILWRYGAGRHHRATVETLAESFLAALRGLIDHCRSPEAGGYTPSDFPDAELDQERLDRVLAELNF
ncbi:MAG: amino acid adenylation domain-containing protein, partial [Thermoanaerobaculia bacterium]